MKFLYLIIFFLLSCRKYPIKVCEPVLKASIEFESTEGLSHVEVYVSSGGRLLFADIFNNYPYENEYPLKGFTYDTLFVNYKIFSWVDGSFYYAKDTLIK